MRPWRAVTKLPRPRGIGILCRCRLEYGSMRENIAIVGIGETPPVRRSDKNLRELVVDAILAALEERA